MNLYPALVANMGSWKYYIVKMRMRELADAVKFASELYDDRTLDEAIQRTLNEGRVKKEIVKYLSGTKDRFFASIVVAALGGALSSSPLKLLMTPGLHFSKVALGNSSVSLSSTEARSIMHSTDSTG